MLGKGRSTLSILVVLILLTTTVMVIGFGTANPSHLKKYLCTNQVSSAYTINPQIVDDKESLSIHKTPEHILSSLTPPFTTFSTYRSHLITKAEVLALKEEVGVREPDKNYNLIINGFGTGLAPPTEDEWNDMIGTIEVVDSAANLDLPAAVDHSASPYFPEVRSQGSQASCSAWAATYYSNGYSQAKENNWTLASSGNNLQLLNPGWTYNKVNKGYDKGSSFWRNYKVLETIGAVTWATMPYNSKDDISWGTEAAWREAPRYRVNHYRQTDAKNIDVVRSWLSDGFVCPISIDANMYNGLGDGDDTINSTEYNSTSHNHANAVVSYDDDKITDSEVGAFKIVNSWGKTFGTTTGGINNTGGWNGDGFFWMTYKAFAKLVKPIYMFYDKVDYEPILIASWNFTGDCSRDATISLGVGDPSAPRDTRELYRKAGSHNYPQFMCLDISEFINYAGLDSFFLKLGSGTNKTSLSSFKLELYEDGYLKDGATLITSESPDVPITTPCTATNKIYGYQVKINSPLDSHYYKGNIQSKGTANHSISETILFEDFEGAFPNKWEVGDNNTSFGLDYWGNSTYRYGSGFHSGWCAGVQEPIFEEDFDSGAPVPSGWETVSENTTHSHPWVVNNTAYDFVYGGDDYGVVCDSHCAGPGTNITEGLYTDSPFDASEYSNLCLEFLLAYRPLDGDEFAQVLYANGTSYPNFTSLKTYTNEVYGKQSINLSVAAGEKLIFLGFRYHGTYDNYMFIDDIRVMTNISHHKYDNEMLSYMYHEVNLTKYEMVNLTYEYFLDLGTVNDSLYVMYYSNGDWHYVVKHNTSTADWVSAFAWIPTGATHIGFQFESDSSVSDFEGAFIDNIRLTGDINISSLKIKLDSGAWQAAQGLEKWAHSINTPSYLDGEHTISVSAAYGGYEAFDVVKFIIDNSPPEPFTPTAAPVNWTSNVQPVISFAATDETSYIDYYELKIDNGNFDLHTSPYTLPLQSEGTHTITVRAYDIVGNHRDVTVDIFIDTSKPNPLLITADPWAWTNDSQPEITFSTTDSISGVDHYMVKIDSGNFSNQTSPYILPVQTDGIHFVTVRVYDQAENFRKGSVYVYIDVTNPEPFEPIATPDNWTSNSRPVISFETTDNLSGIEHYEMKIESQEFFEVTSPYTLPSLTDGVHNITLRGYDQAGNHIDGTVDVYIDTTRPGPFTPTTDPATWTNSSPAISFSTTDATSGVKYYELKIDSGDFTPQASPYILPEVGDGTHDITVRAFDFAGNFRAGNVEVFIDKTKPDLVITYPIYDAWLNVSEFDVIWNSTDDCSGISEILIQLDDEPELSVGTNFSYTLTGLAEGEHNIKVTVVDKAFNENSTQVAFKIDIAEPLLTIDAPDMNAYLTSSDVTVLWAGSDTRSGIDYFEIKSGDKAFMNVGLNTDHQFTGFIEGNHMVVIRCLDHAGNSILESVSFSIDTIKPSIMLEEPTLDAAIESSTVKCYWIGTDDGVGIDYYELKMNNGNYINVGKLTSYTFTGTGDGTHTIFIKATDLAGNENEISFEIEVNAPNVDKNGPAKENEAETTAIIFGIIIIIIIILLVVIFFIFTTKKKKPVPPAKTPTLRSTITQSPSALPPIPLIPPMPLMPPRQPMPPAPTNPTQVSIQSKLNIKQSKFEGEINEKIAIRNDEKTKK